MPTGSIFAVSVPTGALLYIDESPVLDIGGQIARAPIIITGISAGTRYVTFVLPGYITETKSTYIAEGQWADVDAILHKQYPEIPIV